MSRQTASTAADIRAELARRGMSKREFSRQVGISYSYVLKMLQGRRSLAPQIDRISEFLNKTQSQNNCK